MVPAVAAVAARGRTGFIESEHDDDDDDVLVLDDDDASSAPSLGERHFQRTTPEDLRHDRPWERDADTHNHALVCSATSGVCAQP